VSWLLPALVAAALLSRSPLDSAEGDCAFALVDASGLTRVDVVALPIGACPIRTLAQAHAQGLRLIDVRAPYFSALVDTNGVGVERARLQDLSARAALLQAVALIGSGLDDQWLASQCGRYALSADTVIIEGGARAWRASSPLPEKLSDMSLAMSDTAEMSLAEVTPTEALMSVKRGHAQLLHVGAAREFDSYPSLSKMRGVTIKRALQINATLIANMSKTQVVVLSNQAISPLPRNWFLVRGGVLAFTEAIEFAKNTNVPSSALKRPCFYP
jgi:hypothetical protein